MSWFCSPGVLHPGAAPPTSLAARQVSAPGEVPLAHEQLRPDQLVTWVALVGHHGTLDQLRVGRAPPAVRDLRKLRAGVVTRNLCRNQEQQQSDPPGEQPRKLGTDLLGSGPEAPGQNPWGST